MRWCDEKTEIIIYNEESEIQLNLVSFMLFYGLKEKAFLQHNWLVRHAYFTLGDICDYGSVFPRLQHYEYVLCIYQ